MNIQMEKTGNGTLFVGHCYKGMTGDGIVELTFKEGYGGVKVDFYPNYDSAGVFTKIQHCLIHIEAQHMSRAEAIKVLENDPIVKAVLVDEMDWYGRS